MPFAAFALSTALLVTPQYGASEEWRHDLPPNVEAIVAQVDAQDPPVPAGAKFENEQHEKDIKADIEKGRKYAAEIDKELKSSEDADAIERVNRIGAELAAIANANQVEVLWGDKRLNPFPYSFHLVKGEDVNAFSIPGGYIYIYEGLVKYAESDDELAGVMAHEIGHAAFRHIATLTKKQSGFQVLQIPLLVLAILTGSPEAMAAAQIGSMTQQAFASAWSVQAETASDYGAIQYMRKSKYNPVGVLTFMERLAYRDRNGPKIEWGIYQSHPPSNERAEFILRELNEAKIPIARSLVSTSLRARTEIGNEGSLKLKFNNIELYEFRGDHAIERAEDAAKRMNVFFDTVPAVFEVNRNGYKVTGMNRPLFEIEQTDMKGGESMDDRLALALKQLRTAVFDVNYRLWNRSDQFLPPDR
jgi:hypothetical protein